MQTPGQDMTQRKSLALTGHFMRAAVPARARVMNAQLHALSIDTTHLAPQE